MEKIWPKLIGLISLAVLSVWLIVGNLPDDKLHLVFCNVGQGDASLITYKSTQILIDGGPGNQVLNCLSQFMPFWDRKLEIILLTHPEADHTTGLISVLNDYQVGTFITSPLNNSTSLAKTLEQTLTDKRTTTKLIDANSDFRSGLIFLDTVWPTPQFLAQANTSPTCLAERESKVLGCLTANHLNDYSLVLHLQFGDFDVLLSGDADSRVQDNLLATGQIRPVEILKFPHHGSKTGATDAFLKALKPDLAIISVGKNNYGHPSPQALDLLNTNHINFLRTDEVGHIEIVTDGKTWWKIQ